MIIKISQTRENTSYAFMFVIYTSNKITEFTRSGNIATYSLSWRHPNTDKLEFHYTAP